MKKMDKHNQKKLLKVLDKAADYTKDGLGPDDAIVKAASADKDLTPMMVERVCEAYNKANAVAFMKTASADDRADSYPIADIDNVIDKMYNRKPMSKAASLKLQDYSKDFYVGLGEKPMSKVASASVSRNVTLDSVKKQLIKNDVLLRKIAIQERHHNSELQNGLSKRLEKAAAMLLRAKPGADLFKEASIIRNRLSDSVGTMVINAINAKTRSTNRSLPMVEKTAEFAFAPSDNAIVTSALALGELKENTPYYLEKSAEDGADYEGVLQLLGDASAVTDTSDLGSLNANTGLSGKLDTISRDLEARHSLYDLVLNDPEISSHGLLKAKRSYNELASTFPELLEKPLIMRSVLKKTLAQGGNLDMYELKDLMSASSDLSTANTRSTQAKSDLLDVIDKQTKNKKKEGGNSVAITLPNISIGGANIG